MQACFKKVIKIYNPGYKSNREKKVDIWTHLKKQIIKIYKKK
jgi:hypothetical protein